MATKKFPETFPQKVLEEIQFIDEALHIVCQRDFFENCDMLSDTLMLAVMESSDRIKELIAEQAS